MKDLDILQQDIEAMFDKVKSRWYDLDLSKHEETYAFVTDIGTNEIRTTPEAVDAAERLLTNLIVIYETGDC